MPDDTMSERTEAALDHTNNVHDESKGQPPNEDESLLTIPKKDAARRVLREWDESWKDIRDIAEQWKVNRARMDGYTGVALLKKQDKNEAYIPKGAKKNVASMNKAARLCRRLRATLFGDPALPEATPSKDDDEARDAAEVSTRVLQDLCSEGNLADNLHAGDAFDLASSYGSGFRWFFVDELGGGWRPKQLNASPQAVSASDPFPIDPQTGIERPCDPILRYVTEDGQFTDEVTKAAKVWLPALRDKVMTGKNVRMHPWGVRDLWEAEAVTIGDVTTLGILKGMFSDIKRWDEERVGKLIQNRPQHFEDLLPPGQRTTKDVKIDNETPVFVCTRYHKQCAMYPQGAYLVVAGADEVLHRSIWYDQKNNVPLDIPVTQYKQLTEEGNPYGDGVMTALGPGNELRGAMLGSELEHLDRFANRKTFYPMTSTLQPQQGQLPTGTWLPILPGGELKYEEIPDFPLIVEKMLAFVSLDMDDESGLQQQAQGLNAPSVQSAKQADVVLDTVKLGLSDLRQNAERGLVRGWRIMLQLVRAYFHTPQEIAWCGDDGRYKVEKWTAADLGDTTDVRIQRGTFSMMLPPQKTALANAYYQVGLLSKPELEHVTETSIAPLLGLQANPDRMRVRRQIALWNEGPPEGWQPPQPQGIDPSTGQIAPPAPDPTLSQIWDVRPADTAPPTALMREYELRRAMSSTKYQRWPKEWRVGLDQAYMAARQASQVMDAEQTAKLQEELKGTKEKLTQAQIKLQAPSVSFSAKLTDLDENQTVALMAQEGIQVPPRSRPVPEKVEPPVLDPVLQLEHDRALHEQKMHVELEKAKIQQQTDITKAKIQGAVKQHTEKLAADREKHTSNKVAEAAKSQPAPQAPKVEVHAPITVNIPANKGHKVIRGKDGKVSGTEPNQ